VRSKLFGIALAGVAASALAVSTFAVATSGRHSKVQASANLVRAAAKPPGGKAMPVGDLPGWHQVFAGNFTTAVPAGHFPGSVYGARWSVYQNGTPDTWRVGRECPSKVLSVHNGVLDYYLHTVSRFEKWNNVHCVAAALPKVHGAGQTYGRYSVRFRADPVLDYAMAALLWPNDGKWPDHGEIDFAEGRLDGTVNAFAHHADHGGGQQAFDSHKRFTPWHTATVEWTPGKEVFYLDGKVIGTSATLVPNKPMHPVLQADTAYGKVPPNTAAGHIQIAWVVVYTRSAKAH
jgi:Glycosyl hydrolases family 16